MQKGSYLYSRVIFIHKVVLDELYGECTLAHTSSSYHHQLILRHLCRRRCCCCSPHTPLLKRRKVQVSTLTWNVHVTSFGQNNWHTQSFDKLLSDAELAMMWYTTRGTDKAHSYYRYCAVLRHISVLCVCVVGAEVETLKGECEKCAEGTQCSNPLPLSVRVCMRGRAREVAREGKKGRGMTPAEWPTSLRLHFTDSYLWTQSDRRQSQNNNIKVE